MKKLAWVLGLGAVWVAGCASSEKPAFMSAVETTQGGVSEVKLKADYNTIWLAVEKAVRERGEIDANNLFLGKMFGRIGNADLLIRLTQLQSDYAALRVRAVDRITGAGDTAMAAEVTEAVTREIRQKAP
ncbi:MAG: hypothetical protein ACOY3K_06285 [Candidatus Omnitrophota bacterium]